MKIKIEERVYNITIEKGLIKSVSLEIDNNDYGDFDCKIFEGNSQFHLTVEDEYYLKVRIQMIENNIEIKEIIKKEDKIKSTKIFDLNGCLVKE